MRRCPECDREYWDETLRFCLEDGASLVSADEPTTAILSADVPSGETATRPQLSDQTHETPPSKVEVFRSRPWLLPLLAVLTFAGVGYLAYLYFPSGASSKPIDSVAVLPFVNKSGNADSEYLSDGIAESLVYRLSQLPDLKVSPLSTVSRYKGVDVDPVRAGNDLGVSAVVLGKIVERDGNLTVSAELIDVRQNKLLWGEQYDRKMSDLLATQREIAREIVTNLRLKVSGDERGLAKHYTESNEAYQLNLRARFHWNKRTLEGHRKAIEYLNQAIEKDPNFALAYAALADAYAVPSSQLPPHVAMPKAKAAAKRALELDDTLAEAHTSMARVLMAYEWDWAGAEREFKRAIDLNPRYPLAHTWYGLYLAAVGKPEASQAEQKLALELDPLSLTMNFGMGQSLYWSRDHERAIQQFQRTIELDPSFPPAYIYLPSAYEQLGRYDEAIETLQKMPAKDGIEWAFSMGMLGKIYAERGRTQEARAILEQIKRAAGTRYVPTQGMVLVHLGLGEKDQAFSLLERAVEDRAFQLQWLKVDPRWDPIRSDPRFADIIRRMGLPE